MSGRRRIEGRIAPVEDPQEARALRLKARRILLTSMLLAAAVSLMTLAIPHR
jgi:hypothetical protein